MLKTISAVLVLLASQTPMLAATPLPVYPTEIQYIKYENALEQFFSLPAIAPNAGKYLRTSDSQRRRDGQLLCSILTAYSTDEYLTNELERHRLLYNDPQQLRNENAYTLGVAAAAIDTICTEHRASLLDFVQKYQK
jgi:glycine/D-amino acid oxidase-like deaminating enzyme